uniref:Reverse transcriptase domain-containing protein n=1 Tax=Arundo donax TaxID=35708 RepID=A0A0A8ZP44_ARUDO
MDELHEVVFGMEHDKAPGLDGLPIEFYQHFWAVIKEECLPIEGLIVSDNTTRVRRP